MKNEVRLEIKWPTDFIEWGGIGFKIIKDNYTRFYIGRIYKTVSNWHVDFSGVLNDVIFKELDINVDEFCRIFLNIKRIGTWPEVTTLDMLKETIKLLEYYDEF